jgi:hypothetical protein
MFTAVTKKVSPRAPIVSEGSAPSRSPRCASKPNKEAGARASAAGSVEFSSPAARPRCPNTSKDVGRRCELVTPRPCTMAREATLVSGRAVPGSLVAGAASGEADATSTSTSRTSIDRTNKRIGGPP